MRNHWMGIGAIAGMVAFGAVGLAQEGSAVGKRNVGGSPTAKPVSVEDYVQILQLYARYSHAVDLVIDDGTAYSENFVEDGVLVFGTNEVVGKKAIKAWAKKDDKPRPVRAKGWHAGHTMTNFEINQVSTGVANVIAYFHEGERVSDDIVVNTPKGWLLKRRSPQCGDEQERAADPQRPPCSVAAKH